MSEPIAESPRKRTCACGKTLKHNNKHGVCAGCEKTSPIMRLVHVKHSRKYRAARWTNPEWRAKTYAVYRAYLARPEGKMSFLICRANARAKKAGLAGTLKVADLMPLPAVCPVLGIPLTYGLSGSARAVYGSASLDRLDPKKGYVAGNVRIISWRANHLKSDGTAAELMAVAQDTARLHALGLVP